MLSPLPTMPITLCVMIVSGSSGDLKAMISPDLIWLESSGSAIAKSPTLRSGSMLPLTILPIFQPSPVAIRQNADTKTTVMVAKVSIHIDVFLNSQ